MGRIVIQEMYLSSRYIEEMRNILEKKLTSKEELVRNGCPFHSQRDVDAVKIALRRIQTGRYGICLQCGVPIEQGRLEFIPETPYCSVCIQQKTN